MRVMGLATSVSVNGEKFAVGSSIHQHYGTVASIMAAAEGNQLFLRLELKDNEEKLPAPLCLSYFSDRVEIVWEGTPDVQSGVEWAMWTAEAVGYLSGREAMGTEGNRKFKLTETADPLAAAPRGAPIGLSTVKAPVDTDAGGPPGFDPEALQLNNRTEVDSNNRTEGDSNNRTQGGSNNRTPVYQEGRDKLVHTSNPVMSLGLMKLSDGRVGRVMLVEDPKQELEVHPGDFFSFYLDGQLTCRYVESFVPVANDKVRLVLL